MGGPAPSDIAQRCLERDPPKPKKRKTFPLRLAPKLYQELQAWAEQEMRSMNGQIEFLLREALRKRKSED